MFDEIKSTLIRNKTKYSHWRKIGPSAVFASASPDVGSVQKTLDVSQYCFYGARSTACSYPTLQISAYALANFLLDNRVKNTEK